MAFSISKYINKLCSFTYSSPKFRAFLEGILKEFVELQQKVDTLLLNSDIINATGIYLDRIGEIIGLPRQNIIFSDPTIVITDDMYRYAILGKIAQNSTIGSVEEIEQLITNIFGDLMTLTITDNQDMSATYNVDIQEIGTDTLYLIEMVNNGYLTPKPSGVKINYNITTKTTKKLVYDAIDDTGKYDITDYND